MAKRAPANEKPFTALDKGLAANVMSPSIAPVANGSPAVSEPPAPPYAPAPEAVPGRVGAVGGGDPPSVLPERIPEASAAQRGPSVIARRPVIGPKAVPDLAPEKLSREKRVLLSLAEDREFERCVDRIAEGFGGTPVKFSHVIRACLTVIRHAEGEVIRRAQEVGQLTRPPNGDTMALAEFEHELAKVLAQAFHDAPALR